ncbi:MAG: hypothetical protein LBC96_06110 [Lachnospiraceae bacterium]|nr:hypothetical protein [Lachnospiraceae bacterium]
MSEIFLDYDQISKQTKELSNYITGDLRIQTENEYAQIQFLLDTVASTTVTELMENMEAHKQKTIMALESIDKLLSFMAHSGEEIEDEEKRMASNIMTGGY